MEFFNRSETKKRRKFLRKNSTEAEKLLWCKLRNKQIKGNKFFRQYGICNYVVDFYCPSSKLVVEIDGGQHYTEEGKFSDQKREEFMKSIGIKVLRFSNIDVLKNINGVIVNLMGQLP